MRDSIVDIRSGKKEVKCVRGWVGLGRRKTIDQSPLPQTIGLSWERKAGGGGLLVVTSSTFVKFNGRYERFPWQRTYIWYIQRNVFSTYDHIYISWEEGMYISHRGCGRTCVVRGWDRTFVASHMQTAFLIRLCAAKTRKKKAAFATVVSHTKTVVLRLHPPTHPTHPTQ